MAGAIMRGNMVYFALVMGLLCVLPATGFAQPATAPNATPATPSNQPIELTPGFTKLVRFAQSIATVVIGNPEVADARAQTDRSIAIVGRNVGVTNLIALDANGSEIFNAMVIVGARDAGKVVVHTRKQLHEYWAYRCTADNCVRVQDKLEYLQPLAPIIVAQPPVQEQVLPAPPTQ
jgi:Pilus formation protein N terminal region